MGGCIGISEEIVPMDLGVIKEQVLARLQRRAEAGDRPTLALLHWFRKLSKEQRGFFLRLRPLQTKEEVRAPRPKYAFKGVELFGQIREEVENSQATIEQVSWLMKFSDEEISFLVGFPFFLLAD